MTQFDIWIQEVRKQSERNPGPDHCLGPELTNAHLTSEHSELAADGDVSGLFDNCINPREETINFLNKSSNLQLLDGYDD